MTEAERIESAAADWLARQDAGAWTEADQQQLDAWIAESIAHRVAWLRLSSVWQRSDRLSVLRPPPAQATSPAATPASTPIPLRIPPPESRPRAKPKATASHWLPRFSVQRIAAGMLVVAASCSWLGWRYTQDWQSAHYATVVGARQSVALADGSVLTLNTATHVRALVNESGRKVWLDDGEAYFDIAHDKNHPSW
jgi:transmembrane sensor